jgi:NAD dependent epimerase/dehydratase
MPHAACFEDRRKAIALIDSSMWQGRKVLLTGAGGFIGSHLAERLIQLGAQTRCFLRYSSQGSLGWLQTSTLRSEMEIVHGDIRDSESVLRVARGVDIIFHLAALIGIPYSYHSPRSYVQTNVEGTLNVLEAARRHGAQRIICTSTSEVYGSAIYVPIDEDHPLRGQSPYSASKIGADKLAESYHLSFGLPVSIARPFNTYGPRQSSRAVIPTIITQALTNPSVKLGNLHTTRDFNFVTDTAEAFLAVAESSETIGKTLNIGSGTENSIEELVELIFELTGTRLAIDVDEVRVRPEASEVDRLCANSQLLRQLTDWEPLISLREGLSRTIEWVSQNLDAFPVGSYAI